MPINGKVAGLTVVLVAVEFIINVVLAALLIVRVEDTETDVEDTLCVFLVDDVRVVDPLLELVKKSDVVNEMLEVVLVVVLGRVAVVVTLFLVVVIALVLLVLMLVALLLVVLLIVWLRLVVLLPVSVLDVLVFVLLEDVMLLVVLELLTVLLVDNVVLDTVVLEQLLVVDDVVLELLTVLLVDDVVLELLLVVDDVVLELLTVLLVDDVVLKLLLVVDDAVLELLTVVVVDVVKIFQRECTPLAEPAKNRSRLAVKTTPHPWLDLGCAGGFNFSWSLQKSEISRNQNSCPSSPYQFEYRDLIYIYICVCVYIYMPVGSAQGCGGSFKYRKPIGQVSCCDALPEQNH